ncbi:MAG: AIR carboxylase family protein [Chloroflexota bacterium]|nr:AIR carboxylase family protein [Chloroflexota bacterium]
MDPLVVIVMGSRSDLEHARQIQAALAEFDLTSELRVASAHKSARHLLQLLTDYESRKRPLVYIAVAGRSNALGGLIDANTTWPVINCPPYSDRFGGADIFSSLRMPCGVACLTVLEPQAAALAAAKILALHNPALAQLVRSYQKSLESTIVQDDEEVRSSP